MKASLLRTARRGFTLIEVMVATAIMIVIVLAVVTIAADTFKAYDRAGPRLNSVRGLNPDALAIARGLDDTTPSPRRGRSRSRSYDSRDGGFEMQMTAMLPDGIDQHGHISPGAACYRHPGWPVDDLQ